MLGDVVPPVDKPLVRLRVTCGPQASGWAAPAYKTTFTLGCAFLSVLQFRKNYSTLIL